MLRTIFTVTPERRLFKKNAIGNYNEALEPFKVRVRHVCVENIVVVENPFARAAARTALVFLRPDVPTRVVKTYFV